ncbi:hypothetical protein [Kordiimonas sp.]|uniref:hypothetical protein n=1 Tax=Kordiimonas sp. TaxID=1970157 RepID=UPI003A8D1DB5
MKQLVFYDSATGSIPPDGVRFMSDEAAAIAQPPEGCDALAWEALVSPDTHMVDVTQTPAVVTPYTPPVDMNVKRREAKAHIDWKAAKLRSWVGSHGYGQEMVYLAKEIEARACATDPVPDPARYPLLAAEVGITGDALEEVAAAVVAKADEWKAIAAEIEAVRLATKQAIDAAPDHIAIDAAMAGASWPALTP